jgi:hypothetical protein
MLDLSHLPPASLLETTVFYAPRSTTATNSWQTWTKPRGCTVINILAIGTGGPGARATAGNNSGAGGGGSGSVGRLIIPAQFLPDTLFIRVGVGGAGATANGLTGSNSSATNVMLQPNMNNASSLIQSGIGGSGGAAGGAGSASGATSFGNQALFGITTAIAGIVGGTGGSAGNPGGSVTFASAAGLPPLTPGAGGGGGNAADTAGGSQIVTNSYPFATLAGVSAGAGLYGHGYNKRIDPANPQDLMLIAFTGGCGGGASNGGTGGRGGDGAYGCGGGGGGNGSTSGNGGNAGDGLVIISAW